MTQMQRCLRADDAKPSADRAAVPVPVYLLSGAVFATTTAEFMVAGIMPSLSAAFAVSVAQIGYLISLFAVGMTVGGPLVTALLLYLKVPNKPAFLWLLGLFLIGSVLTAVAPGYGVMAAGRVVQGITSGGCFGIGLTICAGLVRPEMRGHAVSIILAGLMLAPVVGVPAMALIDQSIGWRASFWAIVALAALSIAVIAAGVPASRDCGSADLKTSLAALRNRRLWAAYLTSALIIGATFAAFSYFSAVFTQVAGMPATAIPILLAAYGVANVVGNLIIGRFADRYTIPIQIGGLTTLALALGVFATFAAVPVISAPPSS